MSNPYSAYRESQVLIASPLELVHLAYEGAIASIREAENSQSPEQLQRRRAAITKAQLIIGELQRMLDFDKGGEIAVQLSRLYDYMQSELGKSVFAPSIKPLQAVRSLLATLDEGWSQVSAANASTPAAYTPSPELVGARASYTF
jgi:flagellar protein FliS